MSKAVQQKVEIIAWLTAMNALWGDNGVVVGSDGIIRSELLRERRSHGGTECHCQGEGCKKSFHDCRPLKNVTELDEYPLTFVAAPDIESQKNAARGIEA